MTHWLQLISIVKDQVTVNQGHTGGGTVYLDGISVGSLPTYGRITFKATLGKHTITLECPGSSSLACNQNTERIDINITEISPCTEGAFRQVKCPTTGLMINQKCTGNAWVTIKEDESKCSGAIKTDYTKYIITIVIIVILYFSFMKKG